MPTIPSFGPARLARLLPALVAFAEKMGVA